MRVLVIGASGDLGRAISDALRERKTEIITAGLSSGDINVDLTDHTSIEKMYKNAGVLDAVVCAAGGKMSVKPLYEMSRQDYLTSIRGKLLAQLDVVLTGLKYVNENGSFTLTTGVPGKEFIPGGSAIALVNNAIEGFVQSASLEMPKKMRLNAASPKLIDTSEEKYKDALIGFESVPAGKAALLYVKSIFGVVNGQILTM